MAQRLTDDEIAKRMVELRNLRKLHANCAKDKANLRVQVTDFHKPN